MQYRNCHMVKGIPMVILGVKHFPQDILSDRHLVALFGEKITDSKQFLQLLQQTFVCNMSICWNDWNKKISAYILRYIRKSTMDRDISSFYKNLICT